MPKLADPIANSNTKEKDLISAMATGNTLLVFILTKEVYIKEKALSNFASNPQQKKNPIRKRQWGVKVTRRGNKRLTY